MTATANTPAWIDQPLRRAVVYGLGLSGQAASRFLLGRGVEVLAIDRRDAETLGATAGDLLANAGFECRREDPARELPVDIDLVVVSPGITLDRPDLLAARRRGAPVIAEVELAFPYLDGPVVAITGSNGKSTTTSMTGALFAAAGRSVEVCGNIGVPLISRVEGPAGRTFVVELSSFQLESVDLFRPRAAALLNLSPDHLDRHGSLAQYAAAKHRVFERQGPEDWSVVNADDPWTAQATTLARRRSFSSSHLPADGCGLIDGAVVERSPGESDRELFAAAAVSVPGPHNVENAMAAALLARAFDIAPSAIQRGLANFVGLPHRVELVLERDGVRWFDDSKGTNPDATAKSLASFPDGSVHLVLGGRNKGADFRELAPVVRRKARHLYLIGESASTLEAVLGDLVPTTLAGTLERAVAGAAVAAVAGDVVLLSPACSSFDQFRDYNHRGDEFRRLARALPSASATLAAGA